jgi:integrase
VLHIPDEWQEIMGAMTRPGPKMIVRYAVELGKAPSKFSEDDLSAWRGERVRAGRSFQDAQGDCSRFRTTIVRAGLSRKVPLIKPRDKRYGVAIKDMHQDLRSEIERIIEWKVNEFEVDRPAGARIREISARRLVNLFEQLTGYIQNIEGQEEITKIAGLVTRRNIAAFTSWASNKRHVKGQSLSTGLGMVYASLRHNPLYAGLELSWFENIIDQLPVEDQTAIANRKAKKYISYLEAEQVPARIRAKRMRLKAASARAHAIYARNELLMLWILLLPWRQPNIRELRIGGANPNLTKSPIRQYSTATQPLWIAEEFRKFSGTSFWQVRFEPAETKMKNPVQLFVPSELIPLLEQYLTVHRPVLVEGCTDPDTVFVSHSGGAMNRGQMLNLVKKLAFEHTGVPTTPHLYRDIVAYAWLQAHPEDYLTVSKLLWHKNINTTIRIYGHRFDESTGVARMDDWRASRRRPSEI